MKKKLNYKPQFLRIPFVVCESESLRASDKLLYWVIYYFSQMKNKKCIASNDKIGMLCGVGKRAVQSWLTRLENAGFIKRTFKEWHSTKSWRTEIKCLTIIDHSKCEQEVGKVWSDVHHIKNIDKEEYNTDNNELLYDSSSESSLPLNTGNTKDAEDDDSDISKILKMFNDYNPAVGYKNQAHIKAIKTLLSGYTMGQVISMTEYAISVQWRPFAPSIDNPYELFNKLKKLENYFERQD